MRLKPIYVIWLLVMLISAGCAPQATSVPPTNTPEPAAAPMTETPAVTEEPTTEVPAEGYTVTDALGREVKFSKTPERIVLAGKALFMVADAIYLFPDAGKKIVAIGATNQGSGNFFKIIDPDYDKNATLTSEVGAEEIAAVQPDCVVLKSTNAEKLGKPLEAINIPVVYVDFETPDQYERDLAILGQLFQNADQAKKIAEFYQSHVDSITKIVSGLKDEEKPRALILYYTDKDGAIAFNVPPVTWMQTLIIQNAGGLPVWKDANLGEGWTKVTLEQIAAWDPDVIFIAAYFNPVNDVVKTLKADAQWQNLRAVKENKLYGFATDLYSWDQPDTRWILGLTWVAGKLHPDLFPNLDIRKEAEAFYTELYGMDVAAFEKDILPTFTGDLP